MSGGELSELFFTNLDRFVNSCASRYPNKDFKEEITSFVDDNKSWGWSSNTKGKLKENFKKKEVLEEFDFLVSAILGDLGESRESGKGSCPKLKQSSTRVFITRCKIPTHAIRGRKYVFDFGIIVDGKDLDTDWNFVQLGGDKISKIHFDRKKINQGVERIIKVEVTFGSENKTGSYSFAFMDKDGNSMHTDYPIQKEITIIDEPKRDQRSRQPFEAKIVNSDKKGKEVKLSFRLTNNYGSYTPKIFHIKDIEGVFEKISPTYFNPDKYRNSNIDSRLMLKDEKCEYFIFTIVDDAGRDMIREPMEIDLHRDDPEKDIYIRSLPEVAVYGKEITGVLSLKNTTTSTIYGDLKLENYNKDAPIEKLTPVIKTGDIGLGERKNFLIKFTITKQPKDKPTYVLSILNHNRPIENVWFEFKRIEDNPVKQQKSLNETKPKKRGPKNYINKGKITGSWPTPSNEIIVKDMAFKVDFRVKNTGNYEWPKEVKVVFVGGSPIYDFSFDASQVSKLRKDTDGYVSVIFKINSQTSDTYMFDLVDNNDYSILETPLKVHVKLSDKLGISFPASKLKPQHDSSKVDHQYTFHNSSEEIAKLLWTN